MAVIIICAYVDYKTTDDFSLYANEVLGLSEVHSAGIGNSALWMRALVAILAGFLADKVNATKIIIACIKCTIIGGGLLASGLIEQSILLIIINLAVVMVGIYGVRALYFALIQAASIPIFYTGTAVGIISVLGYTPDIFMSPWKGYILDNNPGAKGHQLVFLVLASFAAVGLVASLNFGFINKNSDPPSVVMRNTT